MVKTKLVEVTLQLEKETKGTFRYDNADKDGVITAVYIRKSGMPEKAPNTVTVTVETEEEV